MIAAPNLVKGCNSKNLAWFLSSKKPQQRAEKSW
jgi:hypothetical protein